MGGLFNVHRIRVGECREFYFTCCSRYSHQFEFAGPEILAEYQTPLGSCYWLRCVHRIILLPSSTYSVTAATIWFCYRAAHIVWREQTIYFVADAATICDRTGRFHLTALVDLFRCRYSNHLISLPPQPQFDNVADTATSISCPQDKGRRMPGNFIKLSSQAYLLIDQRSPA